MSSATCCARRSAASAAARRSVASRSCSESSAARGCCGARPAASFSRSAAPARSPCSRRAAASSSLCSPSRCRASAASLAASAAVACSSRLRAACDPRVGGRERRRGVCRRSPARGKIVLRERLPRNRGGCPRAPPSAGRPPAPGADARPGPTPRARRRRSREAARAAATASSRRSACSAARAVPQRVEEALAPLGAFPLRCAALLRSRGSATRSSSSASATSAFEVGSSASSEPERRLVFALGEAPPGVVDRGADASVFLLLAATQTRRLPAVRRSPRECDRVARWRVRPSRRASAPVCTIRSRRRSRRRRTRARRRPDVRRSARAGPPCRDRPARRSGFPAPARRRRHQRGCAVGSNVVRRTVERCGSAPAGLRRMFASSFWSEAIS